MEKVYGVKYKNRYYVEKKETKSEVTIEICNNK